MTKDEFEILRNLPLDLKIAKTKLRIDEWIRHFGEDGVYISFSGGKDSTVLLDIARQSYPNLLAVYVDTGLEYPDIKTFVKTFDNVQIIRPELSFRKVIEKYGYPIISKESASNIYYARRARRLGDMDKYRRYALGERKKGNETYCYGKLSKLALRVLESDIPVSAQCCNVMKKGPAKKFEKETGRTPIIATLAEESQLRKTEYLKTGCNAFESTRPHSNPISFWTEQDVLQYIYDNNIKIAPRTEKL